MKPDAVVVGAGHNGLVAANMLVDAGWDVAVFEEQDTPGGAVRSSDLLGPGFVMDEFSAFYPLGAASPVLDALDLGRHGLTWSHAPRVLSHIFPDDRAVTLSRSLDDTAASLDAFAVGDGDAWSRLSDQWDSIAGDVLQSLFTPFPPVLGPARLLRTLGAADALRLARMAVTPVRRASREMFGGEGAGLLLAGCASHTDLSPTDAGSTLFGWLLCMLGQTVGFPVPRGGAGELTRSLTDRLLARGGLLSVGTPVTKVLVRDGTACGVRLGDGRTVTARRAVLADVDAPTLYRDLIGLDSLPVRARSDLRRFAWDPSTLKVNWALRAPVPWTAAAAREAGTVHLGVDMDGLVDAHEDLVRGKLPTDPFAVVGQMTRSDGSRSPSGTEVLWCYTHVPRGLHTDAQAMNEQVRRLEALLEQHAPGFADLVETRVVQTPGDLERSDANLVAGAINGGTAKLHQQLAFRPLPGLGRAETPIARLYLASASAHPGGGVHGGPGANAARAAQMRSRPTGRVRGKTVDLALQRVARGDDLTRTDLPDTGRRGSRHRDAGQQRG